MIPPLIEEWLAAQYDVYEAKRAVDKAFERAIAIPLPENLRPATSSDIVEDAIIWYPEHGQEADDKYDEYATMMVKTHLSLTHDPTLKGVPKGWTLPIRDILIYSGAKFLCPVAGDISLMPGTGSDPAFRKIDVDVVTGKVRGLHDVD